MEIITMSTSRKHDTNADYVSPYGHTQAEVDKSPFNSIQEMDTARTNFERYEEIDPLGAQLTLMLNPMAIVNWNEEDYLASVAEAEAAGDEDFDDDEDFNPLALLGQLLGAEGDFENEDEF